MYSNERGTRFSILDIIVKFIFAALFILILVWLFQKNVPNMKPFYSNVFRENIKYMQEAGESYFTDDKLPKELGGTNKISLADMFDKKLILPFVDEDGNSCNQYDSYVSVTKTENGYELKTNLVCNNETDYTIKILGCHNYCKDNLCSKTCSIEKITEYKYKKVTNVTSYKCPDGYKKDGKYCVKSKLIDSKSANVTTTSTKEIVINAEKIYDSGTKKLLETIKTKNKDTYEKVYIDVIKETTKETTKKEKVYIDAIKTTTPGSSKTEREAYDCTKYKTETQCETKYKTEAYSCECSTKYVGGVYKTSCNTCYRSVPYQSCSEVRKEYTDTCYRETTTTVPGTTTYSCPSKAEGSEGSGANLKCYYFKTTTIPGTTTYKCPSNADGSEGSGANLKCYYYEKVSGGYSYSCSSNANYQTGTGENLKCYYVTNGSYHYECSDKTYKLDGKYCKKTIKETSTTKKCESGYKLENDKCNKYETVKVKATKVTGKKTVYKWSSKENLSGWTKTNQTRITNGKEICE